MKHLLLPVAACLLFWASCSPKIYSEDSGKNNTVKAMPGLETPMDKTLGDQWAANKSADIQFIATGNEPFWSVEIDFNKRMTFSTPTEPDKIITPVPEPIRPQDVAALSYRASTEKGALYVTIFREKCTDSMSGSDYTFKVSVSVKTGTQKDFENFQGCGRFRVDYRLHDIWALQEMDGQAMRALNLPSGVPTIELQMGVYSVFGFGGCNEFSGTFSLNNNQLKLDPLEKTEKACPALPFETRYTSALSGNTFSYEFRSGKLILTNDDHQLIYNKVD